MSFRRLIISIAVLLTFGCTGVLGRSHFVQAADEEINAFDADILVVKNGSVEVEETIVYNFGDNERHGIYRDIPLTAKDGPDIVIAVDSVKNETGKSYHYSTSLSGDEIHIKIGDPDVLVSGVKTYVIRYTVTNVIRPFEDHDEFYWNVTGNGWKVPIKSASAAFRFPPVFSNTVGMTCFTGASGSQEKNCSTHSTTTSATTETTVSLGEGEGLTTALSLPLGIVDDTVIVPTKPFLSALMAQVVVLSLLSLIILSIFLVRIMRALRLFPDRTYTGAVITAYHPPEGLLPVDVGTLIDRSVDRKDISSIILDLAVRGYLKIHYVVQEVRFWPDKKDFELIKLKNGDDLTHPAEKILFGILFNGREQILLSSLTASTSTYQKQFKQIVTDTEDHLRDTGYFDAAAKAKSLQLITQTGIAIALFVILITVLSSFTNGLSFIFAVPAIVLATLQDKVVRKLSRRLTQKGADAEAQIKGFKEFLTLTEKDKLQLLNAPALEPQMFEKFLPYAMVLGVEKEWARKFEGMYAVAPSWYEDSSGGAFNSMHLVSNMVFFNTAFSNTVSSSNPSSSGFSGGSSGGGSGGGGGGSW
jgi:uncharacterized membrane protein